MEKPIFDPSIPYLGPIYGNKFTPGRIVRIQGITPSTAYSFNIHLQCGPKIIPRDDAAIGITVRLAEGCIIINSLQNGFWGEEQRMSTHIKRAERFEIILMCDYSQYKVEINGQRFCEFPQRIHYDRITHLAIDGDVSITQIFYESVGSDGMGNETAALPTQTTHSYKQVPDFEMVDIPPTYNNTVSNGQTQPGINSHQTASSYTVGASYPTGVPYSTTGQAYQGAAYPASGLPAPKPGVDYPTSEPVYPVPQQGAYPSQGTMYQPVQQNVPPLPPGPLNRFHFPGAQSRQRSKWQKCAIISGGVIAFIVACIVTALFKIYLRKD